MAAAPTCRAVTNKKIQGTAKDAMKIAARIKPLLAGYDHGVQGAVLAELLAGWLATQHPLGALIIEQLLQQWCNAVRRLTGIEIALLRQGEKKLNNN